MEGNNISKVIAYTDGSFNKRTGMYGYGCVLIGVDTLEFSGSAYDVYGGWQIQGELVAALTACREALKNGYSEIEIRYDYEGVRCWPTGEWRAKKLYTQSYANEMRKYMKETKVTFTHVKAHTGVLGNERADVLAKAACGI